MTNARGLGTEKDIDGALSGPVLVIGCGLIGTSIALGLRELDVEVHLADARRSNVVLAQSRGAGDGTAVERPQLVVVAVPPTAVFDVVRHSLETWPEAFVTDVSSVKGDLVDAVADIDPDHRFVSSHPMAGSERSGPMAATGSLFEGRAWAVMSTTDGESARTVKFLAGALGAVVVEMDPVTHDEAVALVSHLPHLMSVLTAARLGDAPGTHLELAGPGLRDVTRIAGSDAGLWGEILDCNADQVKLLLAGVRKDLDTLIDTLGIDGTPVSDLLARGRSGTLLVPGKHGESAEVMDSVFVQISDVPGALSTLMSDTGESGINIEDIRIDHELGRPVGLVEVVVAHDGAEVLVNALTDRGWSAYS